MSIRILQGEVRERLAELPSDSFDCIVTSPPYWGLRDYGVAGQIGLESTLTEYLETMVSVCRELRRVLKPSGTFWLNVGDSYAQSEVRHRNKRGSSGLATSFGQWAEGTAQTGRKINHGLKPKDLCMVPNRLAIRLQEDGWYVRSEIIWHKPNPMPESVTDRPTSSHEKIWLLTKSERYWYDAEAIAETVSEWSQKALASNWVRRKDYVTREAFNGWNVGGQKYADRVRADGMRNGRNVWAIASQPYSEAHFATFPPELAERCIKAGCPAGGHVLDPFGGAGTTGMVADRLGRDATLIELNPSYITLIKNRIFRDAGMFAQVAAE